MNRDLLVLANRYAVLLEEQKHSANAVSGNESDLGW